MAYLLERSERCNVCGTSEWEWDPDQGGERGAYEASQFQCWGCYTTKIAQQDHDLPPGAHITLTPRRQVDKLKAPVPA